MEPQRSRISRIKRNKKYKNLSIRPQEGDIKTRISLDKDTLNKINKLDEFTSDHFKFNLSRSAFVRRACQFYGRYLVQQVQKGVKAQESGNSKASLKAARAILHERDQIVKASGRKPQEV